jgi:chromate transporter
LVERSRGNPRLAGALATVTAAVVGVIANLALWFGWNLAVPEPGRFDPVPPALAAVFLLLLWKGKCGVTGIVGLGGIAGLAVHFLSRF